MGSALSSEDSSIHRLLLFQKDSCRLTGTIVIRIQQRKPGADRKDIVVLLEAGHRGDEHSARFYER